MRFRGIVVTVATIGLTLGPAFGHALPSSLAGARTECTITGTAADDILNGTTRDDVICGKAGQDSIDGEEGNDVIRGGQGDDGGGQPICATSIRRSRVPGCASVMRITAFFGLNGGGGSDVIKGQQDDDSIEGNGQNDRMYGGSGNDCLGENCTQNPDTNTEPGDDFLKTRDNVSGNDIADGGDNTDACRIDAGDEALNCEL